MVSDAKYERTFHAQISMHVKGAVGVFMFFTGNLLQSIPAVPDDARNWALIVNAFGSILLSALLVLLYFKMYKMQKDQTEVMTLQSKVMASSFKPDVHSVLESFDGDCVELKLLNESEARAKNLRLACQLYSTDQSDGLEVFQPTWDEFCNPSIYAFFEDIEPGTDLPNTVRTPVRFSVREANGRTKRKSLTEVIDEYPLGDKIGIDFFLIYENELGNRFVKWAGSFSDINVREYGSVEEAVSHASGRDVALLSQ